MMSTPTIDRFPAFETRLPAAHTEPFVFCSPHSGRIYPRAFLAASQLGRLAIRRSEDAFVDALFSQVPCLGVPLLLANFPRAYLDVNREPYELDPAMYTGQLPDHVNITSVRATNGLGTIARIVSEAQNIYAGPLDPDEALGRIERIYKPFHVRLKQLVEETRRRFGMAILVDCHSMPSQMPRARAERPDFIVGDRYGASCAAHLSSELIRILTDMGYRAIRNAPYAGGFITEHYGDPSCGIHAIQLEINRNLYLAEDRIVPHRGFPVLRCALKSVVAQLIGAAGKLGTVQKQAIA